jgi:hypothetical protein
LIELEDRIRDAGGVVRWARDGDEANRIVIDLVHRAGAREVVKVKSMARQRESLLSGQVKGWRPRRRPGAAMSLPSASIRVPADRMILLCHS